MRRVRYLSLVLFVLGVPAAAFGADIGTDNVIDFPCSKNMADGRVLVDGTQWDERMRDLGYVLEDGAYVPYEVMHFSQQKVHDALWADGLCRMKLLPVAK